jgi:hypothetical protein
MLCASQGRHKHRRHPEMLAALTASLEGWKQAPRLRPSFETPRKGAAPQDDVGMCGTAYTSRNKPTVDMLASSP